jgi:hypothetical protein
MGVAFTIARRGDLWRASAGDEALHYRPIIQSRALADGEVLHQRPPRLLGKVLVMIDHTGIGVADVARSAVFYDAALGALGFRRVEQLPEGEGSDAAAPCGSKGTPCTSGAQCCTGLCKSSSCDDS